jgi:hypothetical protein
MTFAPFTVRPKTPGRFVQVAVPLSRGAFTWSPGVCPVRVFDGTRELPAQVERGPRYPDGSAASIMVYADAGAGTALASVDVRWEPHREAVGEFVWHDAIRKDRVWWAALPGSNERTTMDGPVVRQFRRSDEGDRETWITFFNDCPAIYVALYLHNAHPGASEYEAQVLIPALCPSGWEVSWVITEPYGQPDGSILTPDGHIILQRNLRIVRAVLAPKGYQRWTDAHPAHGWAVATQEWQRVAAWAPHFIPAPDLSHLTGLEITQTKQYAEIRYALANGTNYPPYKKPDGSWSYPLAVRHGFFHPSYAQEGGETSGYQITYGTACDAIQTGSPDALMYAMYQQRMRRDRDRSACIETTGEPSTYEQYKVEIDTGKIRFSADDPGRFDKSGSVVLDGSFGWSKQIPAPASAERTALLGYETTDWAHRIRATYWDSLLLQLANDPISRYLIRMDGEVARMGWHSGHRDDGDWNAAQAGIGLSRDRILGWQLHAMALAFCVGNNALRQRFHYDLIDACTIYSDATSEGGPTICALQGGKQVSVAPYNSQYAVCVAIQEGLLTQGFVAAARATGNLLPYKDVLRAVKFLLAGSNTVWSAATWKLSDRQPFAARVDSLSSLSPAYVGAKTDSEQIRGLLGLCILFARERGESTADAALLLQQMLGGKPRAALRGMGAAVLDSDSCALAACDALGLP